ncbi:MAG: hypothetical protein AAFY57_13890 [Cyanobacteria bacterium J06642_2]
MKVKWHILILKILGWAIAEMALNAIGLDNLADYSEFALECRPATTSKIEHCLGSMTIAAAV